MHHNKPHPELRNPRIGIRGCGAALIVVLVTLLLAAPALAVQVQDLVRIKGAEESKLVGMGLIVGLPGTGDGGKFLPAMRPLATMAQQLIDPNISPADLKDAKNVALVSIVATLPAAGVREGDHVDVRVASIGPAKSIAGGRLFLIPLTGPLPNSPIYAFAEGPITLEDPAKPTTGVVKGGAQLTRDIFARYADPSGRMTLVLNESVATWPMASNLANLINGVASPDGPPIARAVDARNVIVDIPRHEQRDPAAFISQILLSYIDPTQIGTEARVVVNEKTGTIIVTGDVQISPVLISHKGLTLTTITPQTEPTAVNPRVEQNSFASIDPDRRGGARLADLLTSFNQLKVEPADRIAILREIHKSGKLHAKLIEE